MFVKNDENKNFELIDKDCLAKKIFFISNDEIVKSINHSKYKITRTLDNIPSFFIQQTIYSIIFPISLIFNYSLVTSSVPKQMKT